MSLWDNIGNLANIIQIISAIPFFAGAWLFFSRARRFKKKTEEVGKNITEKPMAFSIGLSGQDITGQVKQYLTSKPALKNIPIKTFYKESGVTKENVSHLLRDILKLKAEMTNEGVTEVHLFLMVPVAFAVAIGAILDNWVQVKVYHLSRETGYEYWTYLHKGFIPGLEYSPLKEIASE